MDQNVIFYDFDDNKTCEYNYNSTLENNRNVSLVYELWTLRGEENIFREIHEESLFFSIRLTITTNN